MLNTRLFGMAVGFALALSAVAAHAQTQVQITIENLAPVNGTRLTPMWFGFHNGTFDLYNLGAAASPALERIAEDGDIAPLTALFAGSGAGTVQGQISGGPIDPGQSFTTTISLDGTQATSRFFSYASMVIPSNDFFIANDNPTAFQVFNGSGVFNQVSFVVTGVMVRDAGTEVNDEIPANTAAFGQATPNTGTPENGVVTTSTGFIGAGAAADGPILTARPNADFTQPGYQIARVTITSAPEPATAGLLLGAVFVMPAMGRFRRRQ